MALADREGLKALSMRRLGAELGVEAMTLYSHVSNKDALLDGLVEQLFAQIAPPLFRGTSWKAGLRDYARSLLAALLAHPNVIPLVVSRPAMTSQNLHILENALQSLQAAGFPLSRALDMLYSVSGFVVGHAATFAADAEGDQRDATDQMRSLSNVDAIEFPLLAKAARAEHRPGPVSRFDFALEAMLSGFDTARHARRRDKNATEEAGASPAQLHQEHLRPDA
ncbi:TetR/AcrR family transcriptional regulator C-terminal domain-containing protein [Nonomuraea basaltis]|uniref:TetR/AcrR family transcriptional regulator C-terminal domain-containing protein n=1 Tax=Nonomuraea basaltis TaxID=2495887 RepID=UPI001F1005D4|nr:TetR/AcrR family transcriptional regulator C-terminal domain-containing protein [Nonomuraea basaltis]